MYASLSIDLDNQWSYQKTHGDAGWEDYPSYLDLVVPRILERLEDLEIEATFFIVGKDAELDKNKDAMRKLGDSGHEIANHSFSHDPKLAGFSDDALLEEVAKAEHWIEERTGFRPVGFRAPGFSHSPALMKLLAERGYLYDASTFPTFIGPLARAYHFATSGLSREEKRKRKHLYGSWGEAFRSLKAHPIELEGDASLLEIPVTTMPGLRTPIHTTYLLYLACFSPLLARTYLRSAIFLCKFTRTPLSFLLHPTDFLGCDDAPELLFFPAMNQLSTWKAKQMTYFLTMIRQSFETVTMREHAKREGAFDQFAADSLEAAHIL